jgi:hypothetical protein
VQSGPDTTARRSARSLQQQNYGAMWCTVFRKFNQWMTSRSRLAGELKLNFGLNHEIAGPRIWEPACRKPEGLVNTFTDAKSVEGVDPPLQS